MNRSAKGIKSDMLEWAKTHLYQRAAEEWDYSGRDFDPLTHLLVGACAAEAKNIYDALDGSETRILKRLIEVLLPGHLHLPQPACALATARLTGATFSIRENQQFRYNGQESPIWFSPVFESVLLNARLRVVGSDAGIFEYRENPSPAGREEGMVSKILLGIELPKMPATVQGAVFYVDTSGEKNKHYFLDALAESTWHSNGKPLQIGPAWQDATSDLTQEFHPDQMLKKRVAGVFGPHFLEIKNDGPPVLTKLPAAQVLTQWLSTHQIHSPGLQNSVQQLSALPGEFWWLEASLPYPIRFENFRQAFRFSSTVFPVANRQLGIKDDSDTYFNRPELDVLHLKTEGAFLGIRSVINQQNGDSFDYQPLAAFKPGASPSYSVRYGGVGRMDSYHLWERFLFLFEMLDNENQLREVVEKTGDKLALEELHWLFSEKIRTTPSLDLKPEQNIYLFLHPGHTGRGLRSRIEFWTTDGSRANRLPVGAPLTLHPAEAGLEPNSVSLLTAATGGADRPSDNEHLQTLKDVYFRKGRVITFDDAKSFCRQRLGTELLNVACSFGVDADPRPGFGLSRVVRATLEVRNPEDPTWPDRCRELQASLDKSSCGAVPFRVGLAQSGVKNLNN